MVMTRGQWEALQLRLPPEDRESYENYLKSEGLSTAPATPLAAAEGGTIAAISMEKQNKFELSLEALETKAENAAGAASDAAADARQAKLDRLKAETAAKQAEAKAKSAKTAAERAEAAAAAKKAREEAARLREEEQNLKRIADAAKRAEEEAKRAAEVAARRKAEEDAAAEKAAKEAADKAAAEAKVAQEAADKAAAQAKADADAAEAALAAAKTAEEKAAAEAAAQKAAEDAAAAEAAQKAADEAAAAAKLEKEAVEAAAKAAAEAEAVKKTLAATAAVTAAVTAVSTAAVTAVATAAVTAAVTAVATAAVTAAVTAAATVATTAAVTATVTAAVTAVSTAAVTAVSTAAVTATVSIVDSQYLGTGASRVLRTYYSNGTFTDTAAPELIKGGASEQDAATLELLKQLQAQNATLMAQMAAAQQQAQADAKAAAEAAATEKRESAIKILTDRFTRYGLASLVPKIRELATKGASQDTITLELQESDEYQERFKANKDRIKKGLSVLDPGEYLGLEDSYRQILRAYGLKQFDTDAYVSQFISNDISTAELSSRVQLAVQRVRNADPATLDMLNKYYKIGETDLVAYALDPETQFQKFERQVAAAEIGAAAELQGIKPGVAVAEQLAAQGVTQAEARKGYSTIADILPTSEKLSQIYGNVLEGYGLAEAEQEVFNSLASAQRKRRRLTEREIAAFSGQSGLGRTSLTQQTGGTI